LIYNQQVEVLLNFINDYLLAFKIHYFLPFACQIDFIFHMWNSFQGNHETFFCDSWKCKCFSFEGFLNIILKIMFIRLSIFQYIHGKSFVIKLSWILKAKLKSSSTIGGKNNMVINDLRPITSIVWVKVITIMTKTILITL
jgi:hypothetical protein